MNKNGDMTIRFNRIHERSSSGKDTGMSSTAQLSKKKLFGEIPIKQKAFLEIIGRSEHHKVVDIGENEVIIGRSSTCRLQLLSNSVSRKHARIFFRNEEYYIEDLGSTNGTYVNGIRVVKCALRKNDLIDIGGVKILFNE